MAKKKAPAPIDGEIIAEAPQTTGTAPEHMDLTDEQTAPPPDGERLHWPENRETVDLPYDYDNEALAGKATKMSKIIQQREVTKRTAKNVAATYKAEIDELDADLSVISADIEAGKGSRSIPCVWHYETSGKTDAGFVYHPEMKTLVREDTGEVVRVAPITEQERQMEMSLGGQPGEWSAPEGDALGLPAPGESEAGDGDTVDAGPALEDD